MELAYCVPLGLPHSEFLSWAPDDQDKALAYMADQSQRCKDCGTRDDDWDPKLGGSRTAFVAEVSRCLGCEVIEMTKRDLSDGPEQNLGVRIGLTRNDDEVDD